MKAAVVKSFDHPPRYEEFAEPVAIGDEKVVDVLAVGLHPRVRSGANGTHYTSEGTLPMVPGFDAVARRADGSLVYFVSDDGAAGTMAERAVLDPRRAVLGATGNAGRMAMQIAKLLGAGEVIAAGRNPEILATLPGLGADRVVSLEGGEEAIAALAEAAAEVDVVVDYLWGKPAEAAIPAIVRARTDRARALRWVSRRRARPARRGRGRLERPRRPRAPPRLRPLTRAPCASSTSYGVEDAQGRSSRARCLNSTLRSLNDKHERRVAA
jgi:NADPH:quinone reductase-like Zn-dependent oxidoreductase